MEAIDVRFLTPGDIGLLREIDRREQLEVEYTVVSGKLEPLRIWQYSNGS